MEKRTKLQQLLHDAKPIALTDEANAGFLAMNKRRDWTNTGRLIAKVSERIGIPLSSGRVAYDEVNRRLLIVD